MAVNRNSLLEQLELHHYTLREEETDNAKADLFYNNENYVLVPKDSRLSHLVANYILEKAKINYRF